MADARRFMLSLYTSAKLPTPPATCDRTYGLTDWTPMGNSGEDEPPPGVKVCGDCAYAGIGHQIMAWSMGATKKPLILPDTVIVQAYADGTGYNPVTGAGDNGSVLMDVLEQHRTKGIGGNQNVGYGALSTAAPTQIMQAIYLFGGAYIGLNLPQSAIEQTDANLTWTTPWFSPIVGGHCVILVSYTATHLWCITWGKFQAMSWDFFFRQCDEAYGIIDPIWIAANGEAPDSGLNIAALTAAQQSMGGVSLAPPIHRAA